MIWTTTCLESIKNNMNYFLAKSEPDAYSIDDLQKEKTTTWNGVKNPTARIVMRSMRVGDRVFFYHSTGESQIVGLMEVISNPIDDPDEPRSTLVDMKFVSKFGEQDRITLKEIKAIPALKDWELVKISRLSVMKVPVKFLELPKVSKLIK